MAKRKKKRNQLVITLVRSPIGYAKRQKATVRALGLRRMGQSVLQDDTPVIRGMVGAVNHLVTVEEAAGV